MYIEIIAFIRLWACETFLINIFTTSVMYVIFCDNNDLACIKYCNLRVFFIRSTIIHQYFCTMFGPFCRLPDLEHVPSPAK